jgi:hypothetical protein
LGLRLRLRLQIDSGAAELHAIRWETLRDPTGVAIATSERILTPKKAEVSIRWARASTSSATLAMRISISAGAAPTSSSRSCQRVGRRGDGAAIALCRSAAVHP